MRTVAISGVNIDMKKHEYMPNLMDGMLYEIVDGWYQVLKKRYPGNVFDVTKKPLVLAIKVAIKEWA